jgi:hypothetical protein
MVRSVLSLSLALLLPAGVLAGKPVKYGSFSEAVKPVHGEKVASVTLPKLMRDLIIIGPLIDGAVPTRDTIAPPSPSPSPCACPSAGPSTASPGGHSSGIAPFPGGGLGSGSPNGNSGNKFPSGASVGYGNGVMTITAPGGGPFGIGNANSPTSGNNAGSKPGDVSKPSTGSNSGNSNSSAGTGSGGNTGGNSSGKNGSSGKK